MTVPAVPVLLFKFLFWALALAVFLRRLAMNWRPAPADARRQGAAMLLGMLLGAKLVYALTYPVVALYALIGDTRSLLLWAGAGAAPGAVLGGVFALRWVRRRTLRERARHLQESAPPSGPAFDLDQLVIPAALALAILDCGAVFWALSEPGFGVYANVPWALDFGDGIPRHPVMLYEAAYLFCAAWVCNRMDRSMFLPGERAMLFIAGYCGLRVLTDFFRPPFGPPFLTEMMHPRAWIYFRVMTAEQWICLLTFFGLLPAWFRLTRRLLRTLK
ncbi:MAG TPA: prolipoprotein diacylglyceryl transferase family protein [Burkholderiales bacterium]|jgi:prolipoprotein diacylglyceryltransferase